MSAITEPVILDKTGTRIAAALEAMAIGQRDVYNGDWSQVQNLIDQGLGGKAFPVGTVFEVQHETSVTASVAGTGITAAAVNEDTYIAAADGDYKSREDVYTYDGTVWYNGTTAVNLATLGITLTGTPAEGDSVIIQVNTEKLPFIVVESDENHVDLIMQYGINNRPFDGQEAFYAVEDNPLTAGTYYFTVTTTFWKAEAGIYEFTLQHDVPVGGMLYGLIGLNDALITARTITSYDASGTVIDSGLSITKVNSSAGTLLGDLALEGDANHTGMNSGHRCSYGSNHWGESNIRQWLNSDAAAGQWFTKQTKWDMLAAAYSTLPGFQHGIDKGFVNILAPVECINAYNTIFNANGVKTGSYTTEDKFYLPSMKQLGYGNNNNVAEGTVWEYFNDLAELDRRVFDITNHSTARIRWMRSAVPGYAHYVRYVHSVTGALYHSTAYNGYCAAPACRIIRRG